MPIVIVLSLPPEDLEKIPPMISEIRDTGARALQCSASNVWVMFQPVPAGYYLQGTQAEHGQPSEGILQTVAVALEQLRVSWCFKPSGSGLNRPSLGLLRLHGHSTPRCFRRPSVRDYAMAIRGMITIMRA